MKKLLPLIIALLCVSAYGQSSDHAVAKYSENGKLISLSNLSGLSDCPTKGFAGKVKEVKLNGDIALVRLREKKVDSLFELSLNKLAAPEREVVFDDLITKKNTLRVAGYTCTSDAPITPFSIDRVY